MHTEFATGNPNPPLGSQTSCNTLSELGWDDRWKAELADASDPSLTPGRVSRIDRGAITVLTSSGARRARIARGLAVAVGDWVTIRPNHASDDLQVVAAVLPRRTFFRRAVEGSEVLEQVVAANIDTVLIVNAIDGHLSVRHLERYLALAWQSGATPVVVITKADLASSEQVDHWSQAIEQAAPGVPVHVISTVTDRGIDDLAPYLAPGRTVALVGLSGAGKSTLVNLLAGVDRLATGEVRADGQGRHTTTHRELVLLPSGGLIIDTPGMRALSVWGAADGVRLAFADLDALAAACAFTNCSHASESGCAVRAALASGHVSADRLATWLGFLAQPQPPNRDADRLKVLNRKRQKTTTKAARRSLRTETVRANRAAAAGDNAGTAGYPSAPL